MSIRLPPLLALRAFEAAARHLSFTNAASEMHLTQGAISRQIRTLEDHLGQKLFERLTRRIELTPAGADYFRSVQQAMNDIALATRRVMRESGRATITLSIMPTLGAQWLMPKLSNFSETHPEIDLRLESSIEPVNFQAGEIDAAIRVGQLPGTLFKAHQPRIEMEMVTSWSGVVAQHLFPDVLVPVLSRRLLEEGGPIGSVRDLLNYRLIHTASRKHAWPDWLAAHDVRLPEHHESIHFGHFFMGLRAAQNGKGVAIVPSVVLQHLFDGTDLVCPFQGDVESAGNYYLLTRAADENSPTTRLFLGWLLTEAANEVSAAKVGWAEAARQAR
jgi:LysR family glycine cleavage system transcriptional activator